MVSTDQDYAGFRVSGRSISEIRGAALRIRETFKLPEGRFDLEVFLESLYLWGVTVDVVEDDDEIIPDGVEACCVPEQLTIYLRRAVYESARRSEPRALFTVFHELAHLLLGHRRTWNRERNRKKVEIWENSEWQADQFSAEITMPLPTIKKYRLNTAAKIATHFGVSMAAAGRRIQQLVKRGEL